MKRYPGEKFPLGSLGSAMKAALDRKQLDLNIMAAAAEVADCMMCHILVFTRLFPLPSSRQIHNPHRILYLLATVPRPNH